MVGRRAIFLDRDGVLNLAILRNGRPHPPSTLGELVLNPDARLALSALKELGFLLIVVTNQPDVRRGQQSQEAVEAIHSVLRSELPIDDILVCYHDEADLCECRKPKPGLLFKAAARHAIDCPRSFLIGDRWRDIDAGSNASCKTIWINHGYAEKAPARPPSIVVSSLAEAATWICQTVNSEVTTLNS